MYRYPSGEDFRWYLDRPVSHDDFNVMNDVGIFDGPLTSMYATISTQNIKVLMDRGEEITVVDVLDGESYEKEHIRGSVNLPAGRIERDAHEIFRDRNELIIVYGASPGCAASAVAADKLNTISYENVFRYAGGLEEWKKAGGRTEGAQAGEAEKAGLYREAA